MAGCTGKTHWTPACERQLSRGMGRGRVPCGSESLRAVGEETDVLRQSHKSVFVAKLEKYVRKQIAAKRRRREGAGGCTAEICAMQQLGRENAETESWQETGP